jgi:hypothetical protein
LIEACTGSEGLVLDASTGSKGLVLDVSTGLVELHHQEQSVSIHGVLGGYQVTAAALVCSVHATFTLLLISCPEAAQRQQHQAMGRQHENIGNIEADTAHLQVVQCCNISRAWQYISEECDHW